MIKNHNQAMSLTELIIASALVGIVMIGAISIDYALRTSRQNLSISGDLSNRLAAAMLSLTRDGMQTSGSGDNPGIVYDDAGNVRNICFRHDVSDPGLFTDDLWNCYSHDATNLLYRCENLNAALAADGECPDPRRQLITLTSNNFFDVTTTLAEGLTRVESVKFLLTTRQNPAAAAQPLSNPEYSLESVIHPHGQSM